MDSTKQTNYLPHDLAVLKYAIDEWDGRDPEGISDSDFQPIIEAAKKWAVQEELKFKAAQEPAPAEMERALDYGNLRDMVILLSGMVERGEKHSITSRENARSWIEILETKRAALKRSA